jgi:hypothetical protein
MVMLEFAVHPDIAVKAPVPIFADRLVQGCISHRRPLEELQEPVGCGHDHVVIVTIIVGCHIDLLNSGDFIGPMLLREPRNAAVGELLDPISGLPHPILDRDGKARASPIAVEHIPLWAFFGRESGPVIDEVCPEELELFPLSVMLLGPLFAILPMFAFTLLKGTDEAMGDISNGVEVVHNLDGSCGCAG